MKFEIDPKLIEQTVNYLSNKPFMEVNNLIQEWLKVKPVEENKEETK